MSAPTVYPLKGRTGNPVANQYVIISNGFVYFQSYRSTVARLTADYRLTLDSETWNCSVTTSKYLHQFIRTYMPSAAPSAREGVKSGEYQLTNLGGMW